MSLTPRKALRRAVTTHARAASLATLLPLMGALAFTSPAKAVGCQAIDASSLLGMMPTPPADPICTQTIGRGNTFEIDFSSVISGNSADFNPANNYNYSLQIANINTGLQNSLSFSNVELLVSGFRNTQQFSDEAISIWQASGQTGQGFSNYSTNGIGQNFGFGTAFKSANFTLTAPQAPGTFGTAGVINTIALNLQVAGVTSFTGAKIRGIFTGATDASANPDFSAGLAIFKTANTSTVPPNVIYGNAFNAEVPGPLSILGAGSAFGWSRRLRRRVKKASTFASVA